MVLQIQCRYDGNGHDVESLSYLNLVQLRTDYPDYRIGIQLFGCQDNNVHGDLQVYHEQIHPYNAGEVRLLTSNIDVQSREVFR